MKLEDRNERVSQQRSTKGKESKKLKEASPPRATGGSKSRQRNAEQREAKQRASRGSGRRSTRPGAESSERSSDKPRSKRNDEHRPAKDRAKGSNRRSDALSTASYSIAPQVGAFSEASSKDRSKTKGRHNTKGDRKRRSDAPASPFVVGAIGDISPKDRSKTKARPSTKGDRNRRSDAPASPLASQVVVGAIGDTSPRDRSKTKGRHSIKGDRDAKNRARRSKDYATASPGVDSLTSSPQSPRSKADRASKKSRQYDESEKNAKRISKNKDFGTKEEEVDLQAPVAQGIAVDEEAEENERFLKQEEANRRMQIQLEEMTRQQQISAEALAQKEREAERRKKKRRKIICAIIVFLVLAGGVVAYFLTRPSADRTPLLVAPEDPEGTISSAPSTNPTSSPTQALLYDPPSERDCVAMKNGQPVANQDELTAFTFEITIGVAYSVNVDFENVYLPDLSQAIQEFLGPILAQCPTATRQLQGNDDASTKYVVGNALVETNLVEDRTCEEDDGTSDCYLLSVGVDVFLKDVIPNPVLSVISFISEAFQTSEVPLVETLQLPDPYVFVEIDSLTSLDPTNVPSTSPSESPTHSIRPTKGQQTMLPSAGPSSTPTQPPTIGSTPSPTNAASSSPTRAPVTAPTTEEPTENPSVTPTSGPTLAPTLAPTPAPTPDPTPLPETEEPTIMDSQSPTQVASNDPSAQPSSDPSNLPTSSPTSGPTPLPTSSPTSGPTSAPTSWIIPITFPPQTTYEKQGAQASDHSCLYGFGCHSQSCPSLDPALATKFTYFTNLRAVPIEGFDTDTNPVWYLEQTLDGSDCGSNSGSTACFSDPLKGGFAVDLTESNFVFQKDTRFRSGGFTTRYRVAVDDTVVLQETLSNAHNRTLGSDGGKVMTVNAGGFCGFVSGYIRLTLE
ncbi:unnamed protein product [Cylindrotheca closterium]|uniref:Uncharacterized protein n=1 Tax=Cylindrotheca closterium TaxID=2856 RepID=A0AAD2G546_9STRA|nr:unnamed protein product [Cylindrotheca closterium]